MKHNLIKKVSSFVLSVTLLLTSNAMVLAAGEVKPQQNSVTVTVEKLTLMDGFVLAPTKVTVGSGESLGSILDRVVGNQMIWQGDRLYAVVGAQSSGDSVPTVISAMGVNENNEASPTQASLNEVGLLSPGQLGERDYNSMSAWMCTINNQLIGSEMAGYVPNPGDVIRVQFSLWGNGADLGQTLSGNVPAIFVADKDPLLEALAQVRNSPYFNQFMTDAAFSDAYDQAMSVAKNLQASQGAVDAATDQLKTLQPISAESITLSVGNLEMNVAQTYELKVTVYPENATLGKVVNWQSANPDVAMVDDNGVVTGMGPGLTTILATTQSGDLSATCLVDVKAIPMTGIKLSLNGLALETAGIHQLSVFYTPENTTDAKEVRWLSSDTGVVEVSTSGLVTATGKGTATITAQTAGGHTAKCEVTVATPRELADGITAKINALPKIEALTLSDKSTLEAIKAEYESCPENAKRLVSVSAIEKLTALFYRMDELEANQALANQVIAAINLLPEPDQTKLINEAAVVSARADFVSGLTAEQQSLVPKEALDKLTACEKMIKLIKKNNQNAARIVMATIADLPQALTLADVKQVSAARKDYEALNTDQQGLVENSGILNTAELEIVKQIQLATSDIDEQTLTIGSYQFLTFLELGKAYDCLAESQQRLLDTSVKDKILGLQKRVKAQNKAGGDIVVDTPWYVSQQVDQVKVTQIAYSKFIELMKNEKISSESTQLLNLYTISLKDMTNYNLDYMPTSDERLTISLSVSNDVLAYDQLSIVTQQKDGTVTVIDKDQYTLLENRIEFKSVNPSLVGIIVDRTSLKTLQTTINTEQINPLEPEITKALEKTSDYMLIAAANPTIQSGLWETVCFARGGYAVPEGYYELFYSNVVKELNEGGGSISGDRTNTDYSKTILALTAIGKDPTDVGGYNLLSKLSNFTQIKRGGMMAYVWALIALDSNNYEIPLNTTGVQTTRELLIQTILDREVVTSAGVRGGFSLYSDSADAAPDTDVTAMTLQSLAKYKDREDVKPVVDRAVNTLAELQNSNGSYGTFGAPETSESTSQVILALTSLGIDPAADPRFIKGDHWILSDLMNYYVDGGGFMHIKAGGTGNGGGEPGTLNGMASYQAMQAMISYNRLKSGKPWIFGITDGFNPVIDKEKSLDDIKKEYEQSFGTTKSGGSGTVAKASGGTAAAGSATGTTATAASKGGTSAENFTPWSFDGTYTPNAKTAEAENSGAMIIDQINGPMIFGGVVILLTGIVGATMYLVKKKRMKRA